MLTDQLINEMGLLKLQAKSNLVNSPAEAAQTTNTNAKVATTTIPNISPAPIAKTATNKDPHQKVVKLDKNEFRLMVKMLQAINHDCIYENIQYDGKTVIYKHPIKTLVFADITLTDEGEMMHLSSLQDLLADESLKRPTWEKLKTLKS